jgi:hypothetical protein
MFASICNYIRHWWLSLTTESRLWIAYFVLISIVIVVLIMEIVSYLG